MPSASNYTIAYDLSDDRERRRIDKLLKGWGFRVQKSVFECRLTRNEKRRLTAALQALKLETGSARLYRLAGDLPVRFGTDKGEDLMHAVAFVI